MVRIFLSKNCEFCGSIDRPRDTYTLTVLCLLLRIIRHLLRGKVDRSLLPWHIHTCARTCIRMCTIPSIQMNVCTWPHTASLFLSPLFLSLSFSLHFRSFIQGMYRQLVRPCRRTGESDKRQGRPGPPGSYKIRNSSKTVRPAQATCRSRYSIGRTRITCARFIKIKDRALKRHGLKCRFARCQRGKHLYSRVGIKM